MWGTHDCTLVPLAHSLSHSIHPLLSSCDRSFLPLMCGASQRLFSAVSAWWAGNGLVCTCFYQFIKYICWLRQLEVQPEKVPLPHMFASVQFPQRKRVKKNDFNNVCSRETACACFQLLVCSSEVKNILEQLV